MNTGRRPAWRWLWWLAALLALLGAWHAAVEPVGALARTEWAVDDWRAAWLAPTAPVGAIVIVDIDEASLTQIGRWPWPRTQLAQLIDEVVERQRAAAVGLDLVFAEPDDGPLPALRAAAASDPVLASRLPVWETALDPDTHLAQALAHRPVVLSYYLTQDRGGNRSGNLPAALVPGPPTTPLLPTWSGWATNIAELSRAAPVAGFINAWPDTDGLVRSVPAVAWVDGGLRPSLAVALAAQVQGARLTPDWQVDGRLPALIWRDAQGVRRLPLDEAGRLRVPYHGGTTGPQGDTFTYLSAAELLSGRLPPQHLAGKIVLIGTSAPTLADLRPTPTSAAMPGVEIHANLLAGLLAGVWPQRPDWAGGYAVLLGSLLLAAIAALFTRLSPGPALAASTALMAALVGANIWTYRGAHLVLPLGAPLLLATVLAVSAAAAAAVVESRRRRSLVRLFSRYVPPSRAVSLVEQAAEAPLEAHNAELTVLFCDLRGFTAMAEGLPPQALRELLNAYLTTVTHIVHGHQGTLDKFIGDAVMAFWGAPQPQADHAQRAVATALALAAAEAPLNAELQARGLPAVRFGIGLATGLACVGDLGSRERSSYTAVGDTVNLAARVESLTRHLGHTVLVDAATREAAADLPGVCWQAVTETTVRGRQQPVTLFTVAASAPESGGTPTAARLEQSPP
ncbi:MAG: adenylate/guanylate cyclase domain-containing protein [Proteobacteria bacterium]|nr:adenylate/guanylate cyclase domain-containing protein [Pseudomonadota bacterium]